MDVLIKSFWVLWVWWSRSLLLQRPISRPLIRPCKASKQGSNASGWYWKRWPSRCARTRGPAPRAQHNDLNGNTNDGALDPRVMIITHRGNAGPTPSSQDLEDLSHCPSFWGTKHRGKSWGQVYEQDQEYVDGLRARKWAIRQPSSGTVCTGEFGT